LIKCSRYYTNMYSTMYVIFHNFLFNVSQGSLYNYRYVQHGFSDIYNIYEFKSVSTGKKLN